MKKEINITIREWLENYKNGKYATDLDMIRAGWYDWFCKDSSLPKRLSKMVSVLKKITNDYILDNFYVWFKNNCPCVGPLYDVMRFEPMDEAKCDDEYFIIIFDDKREGAKYALYTLHDIVVHEMRECSCKTDNKKELIDYINNKLVF